MLVLTTPQFTTTTVQIGVLYDDTLTHLPLDKMANDSQILKCIFINEKISILIWIWLKVVPKGPIDNKSALVQAISLHWAGTKSLSKPMLTQFTDKYMQH